VTSSPSLPPRVGRSTRSGRRCSTVGRRLAHGDVDAADATGFLRTSMTTLPSSVSSTMGYTAAPRTSATCPHRAHRVEGTMSRANVAILLDSVMRTIERSPDCRSNALAQTARSPREQRPTPLLAVPELHVSPWRARGSPEACGRGRPSSVHPVTKTKIGFTASHSASHRNTTRCASTSGPRVVGCAAKTSSRAVIAIQL